MFVAKDATGQEVEGSRFRRKIVAWIFTVALWGGALTQCFPTFQSFLFDSFLTTF